MKSTSILKVGTVFGLAGGAVALGLWSEPTVASTPPEEIRLLGIVRDFRPSPDLHPDFDSPQLNGPYARYVKPTLDAAGKPEYSVGTGRRIQQEFRDGANDKICWCLPPAAGDNPGTFGQSSTGAITNAGTFAQWFRDTPGINLSTTWEMPLTLETSGPYAGSYSYETNDFFPYYPIDGQLFGDGPDEHNFYFTYEMISTFVYEAGAGQFIKYKGDDDAWLFVNDQLVMDHGGIAGSREYVVKMDRLGLTDGETVTVAFFHAERKQPQSQFHFWTNIDLVSNGPTLSTMNPAD